MNSFDNDQAAKLRNASQATTSALAVLTASSSLQTVLQTHLAELLVQERALFGCDTEATPWYPDDSDQWVEVPPGTRALPPGLDPNWLSEVLTSTERRTATYTGRAYPSKDWRWHSMHIVAYKIVAPAAKDTPWYPDDSDQWVEVTPGAGLPKGLDPCTNVEVLARGERSAKSYKYWARAARCWRWELQTDSNTIVAYKVAE